MLTQTLDETMAKAKKYEHTTKAAKFGNIFKAIAIDKTAQEEMIMRQKLDQYTQKGYRSFDKKEEKKSDLIVEDPNEVVINIDFSNKN